MPPAKSKQAKRRAKAKINKSENPTPAETPQARETPQATPQGGDAVDAKAAFQIAADAVSSDRKTGGTTSGVATSENLSDTTSAPSSSSTSKESTDKTDKGEKKSSKKKDGKDGKKEKEPAGEVPIGFRGLEGIKGGAPGGAPFMLPMNPNSNVSASEQAEDYANFSKVLAGLKSK